MVAVVFAVAFGFCVVTMDGCRSFAIAGYDLVVVNDCIGRFMSGVAVVVLVRACSTSSRIIITPLSICGLRVVVVVNDVIYSRFDFGLVFGALIAVCWIFVCLLLSISVLNENGSSSSVMSSSDSDSLLVTSFDDGYTVHIYLLLLLVNESENVYDR